MDHSTDNLFSEPLSKTKKIKILAPDLLWFRFDSGCHFSMNSEIFLEISKIFFSGIEKESRKEMVFTCWKCKSKWKYRRSSSSCCSWRNGFSQWESRTDYFRRRNWSVLVSIYLFGYVYRSVNFETFENRKRSIFNKGWSVEVWRFNQKTSWSKGGLIWDVLLVK